MKRNSKKALSLVTAVGLTLATSPVFAEDAATGLGLAGNVVINVDAPPVDLQVRDKGTIRYVSGGVGETEEATIRDLGKKFDVEIALADGEGKWLSDVAIRISDIDDRTLLDVKSDGPLFYASLPNGKYNVTATTDAGVTQTQTIDVTGGAQVKSQFHLKAEQGLEDGDTNALHTHH